MMDELTYNNHAGCYEGETSDGTTWVSARHLAAMKGQSKSRYWPRLLNPDVWVSDPELSDLDGVELETL